MTLFNFPLHSNRLWYYVNDDVLDYTSTANNVTTPIIRRLTSSTTYALMHAQLGYPGETVLQQIYHHVDGVPKLRKPDLYKTHMYITEAVPIAQPSPIPVQSNAPNAMIPGQVFQIDMGFVHGTKYSHKSDDGDLDLSIGGYNCYLLVVDQATHYKWVFLFRNKSPPINTILNFLTLHSTKEHMLKKIYTDEGGELWGSHTLQKAIRDAGYIMEPTAPDAPVPKWSG